MLHKWLWVFHMNIFTRTMNTKHARCTWYTFREVSSLAPSYTKDCLSSPKYIYCSGNANQLLTNKLVLNTAWRPYEVRKLFSVHNSTLHIFNVERYVGWGCILNCFMLQSQPCFYALCWSAIPTSCFIFNVFYSCV